MELYGSIQSISGSMTASVFTGSFVGDGSGLYGISASGVTGLNLTQIATGSVTASVSSNGFNVNTNTSITGTLKVSGAIVAEQIDVTIYSSSVLYQSGSTRFGDSLDDVHNISGSVNIVGSISLNGQAIGTGKLDETVFNTYTSSINTYTSSVNTYTSSANTYTSSNNARVSALEVSSGSLNGFTSSINTTIKNKLNTDGVISGSVQINITDTAGYATFSSSIAATDLDQTNRLVSIESTTSSLNNFSSSINTIIKDKMSLDNVVSSSAQISITGTNGYTTFSSSIATTDSLQEARLSSLENSNGSLNTFSGSANTRLISIETSTSSLNTFSSSTNGRLNSLESASSSIRTDFNSYTSSNDSTNTTQNSRLSALETTTGSLNIYTSSNNTRLGVIEGTTSSLNSYTSSTNTRLNTIETSTGSLNSFTSSINTTIKNKLNADGVISGSVQIDITQTSNYTTFSSSIATTDLNQTNRLNSLENTTSSLNSYTSSTNTRLSVIESTTASLNLHTSSTNTRLNSLETASGSIRADFNTFTSSYTTVSESLDSRLDVLEAYSGSQQVPTASYALRTTQTDVYCKNMSGAQIDKGKVVRIIGATGDNPLIGLADQTSELNSANTLGVTTENIPDGSFGLVITEGVLFGVNTNGMTAGQLLYLGTSGSFTTTEPVAPNHAVRLGEVLRVQQNNGSIYVRIDNGMELDEAHDVTYTNISQGDLLVRNGNDVWINSKSLSGSYSVTGSLIVSGSQNIIGSQTVSGSLIVLENLQVFGSSSITYVTASQLALSTSFITVNVFEPAERFGGLKVYDSGSSNATASLAWDSLRNHWVYQNASGSSYSGGMLISGPRNSGSLGDEPSLTSGKIMKSIGGDHIDNSIMNETAGVIYVTGSLSATGTVYGTNITSIESTTSSLNSYTASNDSTNTTQNNRLSALETSTSSLNTFSSSTNTRLTSIETSTGSLNSFTSSTTTRLNSIETSTGSLNSYTSSNNTRLGLIETSTGSLNSFTSSINTTIKTRLNTENVLSSSAQVVSALPAGTVSGSSQVLNGTTIHSGAFFNGISVVSGSAQIDFNGIINKPTLVSGSSQITYSGLLGIPSGIVSGSSQITFSGISGLPTLVSGSSQITYSGISGIPTGIVSGSSQITFGSISGVPAGLISGSAQVISSLPSGTVSGSSQVSYAGLSNIPSGIVSGSSQITFGSISSIPSGLVSGSSQITLSSTTGYGSVLNQAVLTTSSPTFAAVSATTFTGALSGNATTASSTPTLTASGTLTTQAGSGTLIHSSPIVSSTSGLFSTGDNSNSIITFNRHPGDYYSQLGFNSTGGIFYRSFNNTAINTSQSWQTVWTSTSLTNLNQLTNGPGYITGISFANVSSKPTTISGYGITDAITTSNISSQSVSNASTVANLTPTQFFNNMGANHSTRTSFDASTPSYDFGFRYVQGNTNGPATGGGSQFYSWYLGLGNDYPATGGGSYGMYVAIPRTATTPYMSVRYNENNSLGSWIKIAAGYADSAGSATTAGNITAYTINQNLGTSNGVRFASLQVGSTNSNGSLVNFNGGSYNQFNLTHASTGWGLLMGYGDGSIGTTGYHGTNHAAIINVQAAPIHLGTNNSSNVQISSSGHLHPSANNTYDCGTASLAWRNVYTNDLHLSNMNKPEGNDVDGTNGNWTIQEGAENLYIINNNNGKKFKISLEEII